MRDRLDELRYRMYDLSYSISIRFGAVSDRTKYLTLSFLVALWLLACAFFFSQTYNYKVAELPEEVYVKPDVALDTLVLADEMQEQGRTSEAFELLATHRNHFDREYSESQMNMVEYKLVELTEDAAEGNIEEIYELKDLQEQLPIYKFVGIIIAVDNDPLYGVTHTVSNTGERTQEQLEVTGLGDVSLDSQVEFFGVPKFDSVSSPIKVEAYVVPVE